MGEENLRANVYHGRFGFGLPTSPCFEIWANNLRKCFSAQVYWGVIKRDLRVKCARIKRVSFSCSTTCSNLSQGWYNIKTLMMCPQLQMLLLVYLSKSARHKQMLDSTMDERYTVLFYIENSYFKFYFLFENCLLYFSVQNCPGIVWATRY